MAGLGTQSQNQLEMLREQLRQLWQVGGFYQRKLAHAGWSEERLAELATVEDLPFTTKQELLDDQAAFPPYGSNLTLPIRHYHRLHQTSGSRGQPLRWLDTPESWSWLLHLWEQIYSVVGVTAADRFGFPFSFGPFIGFWAAFEGATRLGNFCLPMGSLTSQARLRLIAEHNLTILCCTPTYALRLVEVAAHEGFNLDSSSMRLLILAGEPGASLFSVRQQLESAWSARVIDHWGMTEVGSLGIECLENPGGFHLLADDCIAEVVNPATGEPVSAGCEGELVITNLGRRTSPVLRYRTGDRVVLDDARCPCGRAWPRLRGGILGRTDDLLFIRGNNVYPSTIENIVRQFGEISEFRLVVGTKDGMQELEIQVEATESANTDLVGRLAAAVRDTCSFRPTVTLMRSGTLPRSEMKSQRLLRK